VGLGHQKPNTGSGKTDEAVGEGVGGGERGWGAGEKGEGRGGD